MRGRRFKSLIIYSDGYEEAFFKQENLSSVENYKSVFRQDWDVLFFALWPQLNGIGTGSPIS